MCAYVRPSLHPTVINRQHIAPCSSLLKEYLKKLQPKTLSLNLRFNKVERGYTGFTLSLRLSVVHLSIVIGGMTKLANVEPLHWTGSFSVFTLTWNICAVYTVYQLRPCRLLMCSPTSRVRPLMWQHSSCTVPFWWVASTYPCSDKPLSGTIPTAMPMSRQKDANSKYQGWEMGSEN